MRKDTNRPKTRKPQKDTKTLVWENLQLLVLGMTIFGQVTIGVSFLLGQGVWLIANIITLVRDFMLHRPPADKIKNGSLTAITAGLIFLNVWGGLF